MNESSAAGASRQLDPSARSLYGALSRLQQRVAELVESQRLGDPDPDDRFRGLYITDEQVDRLLDLRSLGEQSAAEPAGTLDDDAGLGRLGKLRSSFGLNALDLRILLVAVAPDLDPRFERLYAYLQDDVTRRRASAGLALELSGAHLGDHLGRGRLHGRAPLRALGLLVVEEEDRPWLTRSLRVPDRVAAHLLGDDEPAADVATLLTDPVPVSSVQIEDVAPLLPGGQCYVREAASAAGMSFVAAALERSGTPWLAVDLDRLALQGQPAAAVDVLVREARLASGSLIAGPVEALADKNAAALRRLTADDAPVVLVGTGAWDPSWSTQTPLLVSAPALTIAERGDVWREALTGGPTRDGGGPFPRLKAGLEPSKATTQFRLTPAQAVRAARSAQQQARLDRGPVDIGHLHAGARSQNAAGLERLARRVAPKMTWDDLVLPVDQLQQLQELVARARHRDMVLDRWGLGRSVKGRGLTGLFVGEPGTGKTLSAEVVAGALGLDLYVIDLSTVIDKYIGETEKNLERIFTEADRVNGVLLFDEADAVFGKRSEVRDAHDRYANIETAYLLQRMERFDGMALLTSNLRSNVDEAFTRRLDAVVEFPFPDVDDRLRLWQLNVDSGAPLGADLDLQFLAGAFKLAGGNIRNIVFTAAYLAADDTGRVEMTHLVHATQREYRKMGRLCVPQEFGPYYDLVSGPRELKNVASSTGSLTGARHPVSLPEASG